MRAHPASLVLVCSLFAGCGSDTPGTGTGGATSDPGGVAGPSTQSHRASFRFDMASATEGSVELVDSQEGGTTTHLCGSVSVAGTALTIVPSSPTGAPVFAAHYSATATRIDYQLALSDGSTLVYVLEKK